MGWENILKRRIDKNPTLMRIIDSVMTKEPRTARDILQDIKPKYRYAPTAMQLSAYLKLKYDNKQKQNYRVFWKG